MTYAKKHVLFGLALSLVLALVFWITDLDLRLQALVYSPLDPHWIYNDAQPWLWLYQKGTLPGLALTLAAVLGWGLSFGTPPRAPWRYPCFFIILLSILGPGVLINVLGKGLMGRPRPDEVTQFGGAWDYLRPFQLGVPGRGRSFLCGHCSTGFLFLGLYFITKGWKRWLSVGTGLGLGLGLGVARVCQGAHFPSDVLLCGSLIFTLAGALSPLATWRPAKAAKSVGWKAWVLAGGLGTVLLGAYLFSLPVFEEQRHCWFEPGKIPASRPAMDRYFEWKPGNRTFEIRVQTGSLNFEMKPQDPVLSVHSLVRGFGFPTAKSVIEVSGDSPEALAYSQRLKGLFVESHGQFEAAAAPGMIAKLRLVLKDPLGHLFLKLSQAGGAYEISGCPPGMPLLPGFTRSAAGLVSKPGKGTVLKIEVEAAGVTLE